MTITLLADKGSELLPIEADENIRDLAERTWAGWKDLVSHISIEWIDIADAPIYESFAPSWLKKQLAFEIGDYANVWVFHSNHDVKIWGKAYIHIHWSTDWNATESVRWEFQIACAIWHDQAFFPASVSYYIEEQPNQTEVWPWRHYISEVADEDAIMLKEPDCLAMVTVRRVTNWIVDNTDKVFWLTVDFHYEADRDSTPNKEPNFYN